ncbi:MAG: insulinase family protein [Flavobacterium sp.]
MKSKILQVFLVMLCFSASAQNINLNAPLPIDQTIKKGVLPNGMTYYIKNTKVTKGVASYYIIQNVGSILENDDQQGLAHFLEHMAFNGTKNFPDKGILNTMQKYGLVFGSDINAYTSFDETVYNVNNIPTTPELIDKGLLILHDWSHFLTLADKEIDSERGVVKEEWRTGQNGEMRIMEKSLPTYFNNSKYAKRLPIGLMDVVDHFKYKALRDFYHDWYRTDLQAIAIVGDIDVAAVETKIKTMFSDIPAVENPLKRFVVGIPENQELLYTMAMDDEVTTAGISFGINHIKSLKDQTVSTLKEDLVNGMAVSMLSSRLRELSRKTDATFLNVSLSYGQNTRINNTFDLNITPKPNQQAVAFKSIMTEINRAVKFGFTDSEIQRTLAEYKNFYENQILSRDEISHEDIIQVIKDNYLNNATITDIEQEYQVVKTIFENLQPNEIHVALKNLYTDKNRFLLITGVKGNNNLSKEEALSILNEIEKNDSLTPYQDNFASKTLLSGIDIKPGTIVSEKENKALGSKTFTLSNGIKVHYKFANKNKNDVKLLGISDGGKSLLADDDTASLSIFSNVIQYSGLGDYSATELQKVLSGKSANASVSIGNLNENVSGSSVTKDAETMFQMVYLRFMKPRFDQEAYNVILQNVNNYKESRRENIDEKLKDSTTVALYGAHNPKQPLYDEAFINSMSFDKIKAIYASRFANAADFEFLIVGDVKEEALKPLLEKYLASLPTNSEREHWKDNSVSWLKPTTNKEFHLKMEDAKSTVQIGYKNRFKYSLKDEFIANALGDILQLRYTETLREQEGGTYGASASAGLIKKPIQEAYLSVRFDCNPDKVTNLVAIVHQEINKIANGAIQQSDLDKTVTNYIKERNQEKDYNSYDMNLLTTFYREGYNINNPSNFEKIIKSITIKDVQKFTQKLIKNAKSYEIVLKPQ